MTPANSRSTGDHGWRQRHAPVAAVARWLSETGPGAHRRQPEPVSVGGAAAAALRRCRHCADAAIVRKQQGVSDGSGQGKCSAARRATDVPLRHARCAVWAASPTPVSCEQYQTYSRLVISDNARNRRTSCAVSAFGERPAQAMAQTSFDGVKITLNISLVGERSSLSERNIASFLSQSSLEKASVTPL